MNCHIPLAPTRETARGENPDSIIAVYASSSGSPRSRKIRWIIGRYRPDREIHMPNRSRSLATNWSISASTGALTTTG